MGQGDGPGMGCSREPQVSGEKMPVERMHSFLSVID